MPDTATEQARQLADELRETLVPGTRAAEDAADAELAEAFFHLNPELAQRAAMKALELDGWKRRAEAAEQQVQELRRERDEAEDELGIVKSEWDLALARAERAETTNTRLHKALDEFFNEPLDYARPCWDSFCGGGRHTLLCVRVDQLWDSRAALAQDAEQENA